MEQTEAIIIEADKTEEVLPSLSPTTVQAPQQHPAEVDGNDNVVSEEAERAIGYSPVEGDEEKIAPVTVKSPVELPSISLTGKVTSPPPSSASANSSYPLNITSSPSRPPPRTLPPNQMSYSVQGAPQQLPSMNKIPNPMSHVRPNMMQMPIHPQGKLNNPQMSVGVHSQHPSIPLPPPPPNSNQVRMVSPTYVGGPPPQQQPSQQQPYPSQSTPSAQMIFHHMQNQIPPQKMELHDAFAYLDRVKAEFSDQPEVYNRFLQIMREFKSNVIDANGVIVRVVQLFKGHKNLIQGFNAFLPRTHHIDPVVAETGVLPPHLMQVASLMGVTLTPQGIPTSLPPMSSVVHSPPPPSSSSASYPQPGQWNPSEQHQQSYYQPPSGHLSVPTHQQHSHPVPQPSRPHLPPPPPSSSSVPHNTSIAAAPQSTSSANTSSSNKKQNVQFARAIAYVKKIKQRFANDPDVYRTFLAALHSYHKEQKTILEVYMEVAELFADHNDLLEEFVLFLPENEAAAITSRLNQSKPVSTASSSTTVPSTETRASAAKRSKQQEPPPVSKTTKRARQSAAVSARTAEESAFFERVKRYLGDKTAYSEFLKCLNLFCQDIIKIQDLVVLVQRFIGSNGDLFGWFKRYIGVKDEDMLVEPTWKTGDNLINEDGELNLHACKKVGSYRIYPKSHLLPKSSHRTKVGLEVLNDSMVSCPVFNSEDSTFVASKKNQYEEALFRCEDERFEMDLLIDYNAATISVFEPLSRKIDLMNDTEKASFTLGPELGGTSTVIYKKAIQKIYGDKADEVIDGLMKNPVIAVPVVLRRLKQKDEEWRKVQRDWNKVWRDIHLKNYYKALDHQGIEFKITDRKNISGRTLITEIENIATEKCKRLERGDLSLGTTHLGYTCRNSAGIATDLSKLISRYVKVSSGLAPNDRKAVLRFLDSFLPSLLGLSTGKPNTSTESKPVSRKSKKNGVKSENSSYDEETSKMDTNSGSEAGTMESKEEEQMEEELLENHEAAIFNRNSALNNPSTSILLFANNNMYILTRLLHMCLDRLEKMEAASKIANGQPFFAEKKSVVATFLDLQTNSPPSDTTENIPKDFYSALIPMLSQFVCGEVDINLFEERVRFMFGTAAYPIFTFDKLLQGFVKHIQLVLSDPVCEHLVRLFDSWNSRKPALRLSEYSIRMAAESAVPAKENIYRIEYHPSNESLSIQLLDRLSDGAAYQIEGEPQQNRSAENRWSTYVDEFVKMECNTSYLDPNSKVYLHRNRLKQTGPIDSKHVFVLYNLECKIALNTYKLFYVENTEDFLMRLGLRRQGNMKGMSKRFNSWLSAQMDVY